MCATRIVRTILCKRTSARRRILAHACQLAASVLHAQLTAAPAPPVNVGSLLGEPLAGVSCMLEGFDLNISIINWDETLSVV